MEERRASEYAAAALYLQGSEELIETDPFAAVVLCTSQGKQVDLKTRSKWSRALRFAAASKSGEQSLKAFIKRRGGINSCAAAYTAGRRQSLTH